MNLPKQLKCECNETKFWFFGGYVTCPKCLNRYKSTTYTNIETGDTIIEFWLCRYNLEERRYNDTWEKWKND